jgi:hypothetical protein
MAGSWLVVLAFALSTLLLYLVGTYMLWMPRQCAVLAEVFAASGNFPSLLPRSVRAAVIEVRTLGLIFLSMALFCINLAVTPPWNHVMFDATSAVSNPNWLVFPALLAILAGDVVLFDVSGWVAHTLDFWLDHPLVPRRLIPALTWAFRLAGMAIFLFGAGIFWLWLGMLSA